MEWMCDSMSHAWDAKRGAQHTRRHVQHLTRQARRRWPNLGGGVAARIGRFSAAAWEPPAPSAAMLHWEKCERRERCRDAGERANERTSERTREPPRIRNSDIGACNRSVRTRRSVHGPCEWVCESEPPRVSRVYDLRGAAIVWPACLLCCLAMATPQ